MATHRSVGFMPGLANFETRPATMADQVGIAAVLNASSMANTGTQVTTPDRVVIHSSIFDANRAGQALLLAQGFNLVRSFIHLQIQMESPPPEPDWPEGITVHTITAADWPAVGAALEEAFQDHWGQKRNTAEARLGNTKSRAKITAKEPYRGWNRPLINYP